MKKIKILTVMKIILLAIVVNIAITANIQAFKCPSLTRTQLFLKIPYMFFYNFK
jgi:hypothetical protein